MLKPELKLRARLRPQAHSCPSESVEIASCTYSETRGIELLTKSNELLKEVNVTLAEPRRRRAEAIARFYWLSIEGGRAETLASRDKCKVLLALGANNKTKFDESDYHEIAELLLTTPRSRRKMRAIADKLGKREQLEQPLPPFPKGLASLFKIVVPIGTNYEPIEPIPEMTTEEFEQLYQLIPSKHKAFLDVCLQSRFLRGRSENSISYSIV